MNGPGIMIPFAVLKQREAQEYLLQWVWHACLEDSLRRRCDGRVQ